MPQNPPPPPPKRPVAKPADASGAAPTRPKSATPSPAAAAPAPDTRRRHLPLLKYSLWAFIGGIVLFLGGCVYKGQLPQNSLDYKPLYLMMIGFPMALIGLFVMIGAARDQGNLDRMVKGERFVHWRYTQEEWDRFQGAQRARDPLHSIKPIAGEAEAFVGPKGYYLAGDFWPWHSMKIDLVDIGYVFGENEDIQMEFKISGKLTYRQKQYLPVPTGREKDAAALVKHIRKILKMDEA